MVSLLSDSLFCQDQNSLSLSYSRKTVCNNKGCPIFCQFLQRFLNDFLAFIKGSQLIIHNAAFDVAYLNMELERLGKGPVTDYCESVLDTLPLAKSLRPGQRVSLDALCSAYGINNTDRTLHGALIDAKLLAQVYLAMTRGQESLDITSVDMKSLPPMPDVTKLCRQAKTFAQRRIGDDPSRIFSNLNVTAPPESIDIYPCLMGFHGLRWDFTDARLYFGIYYEALTDLIQRYSDQSASLVSRLKSMGDKNRLEILKFLKNGDCNGQDIAERLSLAPATVSHHMNLLTNEGFVTTTKRGTSTYYTLNPGALRRFLQELEHCLL